MRLIGIAEVRSHLRPAHAASGAGPLDRGEQAEPAQDPRWTGAHGTGDEPLQCAGADSDSSSPLLDGADPRILLGTARPRCHFACVAHGTRWAARECVRGSGHQLVDRLLDGHRVDVLRVQSDADLLGRELAARRLQVAHVVDPGGEPADGGAKGDVAATGGQHPT